MYALTVWQPWASLIAAGAKPYEWRGWAAPARVIGQRIAIHAGSRAVRKYEIAALIDRLRHDGGKGTSLEPAALALLEGWHSAPGALPLSSVLCTARVGEPVRAALWAAISGRAAADSDRIDHTKWAWPLTAIERLEPFAPATGAQGLWRWQGPAAMIDVAVKDANHASKA